MSPEAELAFCACGVEGCATRRSGDITQALRPNAAMTAIGDLITPGRELSLRAFSFI